MSAPRLAGFPRSYLSNTATKFFIVLDHTPLRDDSVIAKVGAPICHRERENYPQWQFTSDSTRLKHTSQQPAITAVGAHVH